MMVSFLSATVVDKSYISSVIALSTWTVLMLLSTAIVQEGPFLVKITGVPSKNNITTSVQVLVEAIPWTSKSSPFFLFDKRFT